METAVSSVGQFAMTDSEQVVAAGPNGLFYFRRVQYHAATPWSESRPFPSVGVTLNDLTVSGLALYSGNDPKGKSPLYLYCVSGGVLYSFYLPDIDDSSFLPATSPPLAGCRITGTPTVVRSGYTPDCGEQWSLVVPCQSGGLLHTSATYPTSYYHSVTIRWEAVDHLATDLGIIPAVSVTAVYNYFGNSKTALVAVCISKGKLNVVQGSFCSNKWAGKTSTRILHPGEVTGNPVLITDDTCSSRPQLDLLVPSAEGGIFHFVRTFPAPDWHMIGRVAFPQNIPPASCLSFHSWRSIYEERKLYALVQIGGRLYHVKTTNDRLPWLNSRLYPIVQPGPFFD
ncbi:hypothetical protein F4804DRAFT_83512 [Jackrogersella minutella]|nr:hypothetical protein F4804DRAFT_83512 [Jackrogersella minutella]